MSQNFHALPDLEGYESAGAKKVRKLVGEWREAFETVGATETKVEEATQALGDAKTRDVEARAVAQRGGKPDPGRPNEEEARSNLEALKDRLGVVRQVLSLVEADLTQALIEHAPEMAEEAGEKMRSEEARYAELAPQMREAHDRARHHGGVDRWSTNPTAYFTALPTLAGVLGIPMTIADEDDGKEGTVRLVAG